MNYLEEMFVTLVLVLMAFFILLRLAQVMVGGFSKFKPINVKKTSVARISCAN
jgi:hypothetical protein